MVQDRPTLFISFKYQLVDDDVLHALPFEVDLGLWRVKMFKTSKWQKH
jgi:hypothetical protein